MADSYVTVPETDRERIDMLRADGYRVVRVAVGHFGDVDGLVLVKRFIDSQSVASQFG